jgi:predicted nucleic acid-binding protein
MKQRIYIDTSVFGGYFDREFEAYTIPLFERIKNNEFIVLFSAVTQDELENAPEQVQALMKSLPKGYTEFLDTSDEAVELATEYIFEKVVGQTSYADCAYSACHNKQGGLPDKLEFQTHSKCTANKRI